MTKEAKRQRRNNTLWFYYGLTRSMYDAVLHYQSNACAICKLPFTKTPLVDHNHKTGETRGLLCFRCNLGHAAWLNLVLMKAGVDYLENSPVDKALGYKVYGIKGSITSKAKTIRKNNKSLFNKKTGKRLPPPSRK